MSQGIDKITDKILSDARAEAEKIKQDHQKKSKEIKQEYAQKVTQLKEKERMRIEEEAKMLKDRVISQEKTRLRLEYLNHRYQLLDRLISSAIAKIPQHKDYSKFLTDILKNCGWDEGEILLSPEDQKRYGEKITRWVKKNDLSFKIVNHDLEIKGGLIIRKGKESLNASLSTIIDELREELLAQIGSEVMAEEKT
ncbi:MAG TPA: hypothetical protein EYP58_04840 [bacterium (Candidatus Stahlbacteria)]|nr:hypothetical protein [Candidatus Stahlbacteria bacterium]